DTRGPIASALVPRASKASVSTSLSGAPVSTSLTKGLYPRYAPLMHAAAASPHGATACRPAPQLDGSTRGHSLRVRLAHHSQPGGGGDSGTGERPRQAAHCRAERRSLGADSGRANTSSMVVREY